MTIAKQFGRPLTIFGVWVASPWAFGIVLVYGLLWLVFEPSHFDFHAGATLATWMMTLFIQRAEHRDTQAIHAKLDELLHATGKAQNSLTKLDDQEPEDIEKFRIGARSDD